MALLSEGGGNRWKVLRKEKAELAKQGKLVKCVIHMEKQTTLYKEPTVILWLCYGGNNGICSTNQAFIPIINFL